MGKTHKANYNKTKDKNIKGFTTEEDSVVVYSVDKNKRWEAYEYEEENPHQERLKKIERKEENKKQKKEDYVLSLKSQSWNIQKTQDNPDYYGTGKAWWKGNKRVDLPEKVKRQLETKQPKEEEENKEEYEEEQKEKLFVVVKTKKLHEEKVTEKKDKKLKKSDHDEGF